MSEGPLIIGVDVGGTNTDSVLIDTSRTGRAAVIASHKTPTTSNVTLGVRDTLKQLLSKSTIQPSKVAALAIGTTHFLNAIIERDSSRVEKVAVLRLASHNFSAGTPPFADWPSGLEKIVNGHSAIIPGGCNIDGKLIHEVNEGAVREQLQIIKSRGLKTVVVVGIGSPTDEKYYQEDQVKAIIESTLGKDINVVCSRNVAGSGLLARENASILNASILNFARRTIRSFMSAMHYIGLKCPLYLTSNAGHLLSFSEAMQFPIRIFSSGATNSIRGAAFLAGSEVDQNGCIVVDIGGTTTDVGYLLKNGYPRLAKSYTDLAGVKINLEMPSVESVGLGGGSILHISNDGEQVLVGPESVGHDLTTKALCFGGDIATATDVANALGAKVGSTKAPLSKTILVKAQAKIRKILETYIDRTKLSPDDCMIILVGGGSVLCPPELTGVSKILIPEHAGVANAIGAAMAKISATVELIVNTSEIKRSLIMVKQRAIAAAVAKGGDSSSVTVLSEEIIGVPYTEGRTHIKIEIACPADHAKTYRELLKSSQTLLRDVEAEEGFHQETKIHQEDNRDNKIPGTTENLPNYRPKITCEGNWLVSEVDLRFMAIGCYLLGCGGGGSPYATYLQARQLLVDGESITISSFEDLEDNDVLPPVAAVGTPAVSTERPGGDMVLHALQLMSETCKVTYTKMLAVEIGGGNGLEPLIWGSSKHYGIPSVDGDLMGRAYPSFEKISPYIVANHINDLMPVALCSGTGENIIIPANQLDERAADNAIRTACVGMGSAAGAVSRVLSGREMRDVGIPNTYSLAWRLGRVISISQQAASLSTVADDIIKECGGEGSARRIFQGKIRSVESSLTSTAHSIGKVTIERLSDHEIENDSDRLDGPVKIVIPFMNENLAVIAVDEEGKETILTTVPDLIMLLDVSTGEAIGVQEYRYGLKVTVMIMSPHPIWTTKRGLEIGGPRAFDLAYDYSPLLKYTEPQSVIEEYRPRKG